jgi:hypothetical protein
VAGKLARQYWRVRIKRTDHLTESSESLHGPADVALCGINTVDRKTDPSPETVIEAAGGECRTCLHLAGYSGKRIVKTRPVQPPSPGDQYIKDFIAIASRVKKVGFKVTPDDQIKFIEEFLGEKT